MKAEMILQDLGTLARLIRLSTQAGENAAPYASQMLEVAEGDFVLTSRQRFALGAQEDRLRSRLGPGHGRFG
jgi:hypothetical protein